MKIKKKRAQKCGDYMTSEFSAATLFAGKTNGKCFKMLGELSAQSRILYRLNYQL
jgi:hypothetical protein